jgi:hypothetical protein
MKTRFWISAGLAAAAMTGFYLQDNALAQEGSALPAKKLNEIAPPPGLPLLTPTANGHSVHILPTMMGAAALAKGFADTGPLRYHSGGSIMPSATLYAIYWIPASGKLQNGGATTLPVAYQNLQTLFLTDYAEHGLGNITTEFYQIVGSARTYIENSGGLGGVAVDTSPYPASGCTDTATPGNCITDAQIQTEIQKVMTAKGWTGGLNKIFLLYTSSGEGSCFDSGGSSCAYTAYCAYHGAFGASPVIYANMPYGNLSVCAAGQPSPNGDAVADSVTSTASHEVTEAITDPLLNAWFTNPQGNEIGDLCAYNYGANTWSSNGTSLNANQQWNGHLYELQQEFDNHAAPSIGCRQVGPF